MKQDYSDNKTSSASKLKNSMTRSRKANYLNTILLTQQMAKGLTKHAA